MTGGADEVQRGNTQKRTRDLKTVGFKMKVRIEKRRAAAEKKKQTRLERKTASGEGRSKGPTDFIFHFFYLVLLKHTHDHREPGVCSSRDMVTDLLLKQAVKSLSTGLCV